MKIFIQNYINILITFKDKFCRIYIFAIFLISIIIHLYISSIGWNNFLLDQYGFRQTQTAITTYYVIKEGFKINYITPILGAPWSIPFEFPLFQWIVASAVIIFKTPIDQTGRFISLLFFYLSLIPLGAILKTYLKNNNFVLIILSLILLNPIYLFWSRTFMIESLALFFGILFCWLAIKLFQTNKLRFLILVSVIGCLAALVKITTFIVLCAPTGFFFIYYFWKEKNNMFWNINIIKKYLLYGILIFIIPLAISIIWNNFSDTQKEMNPLANGFLTSNDLTKWNFGTIKQKTSITVWSKILKNSLIPYQTFGTTDLFSFAFPNLFLLLIPFLYFFKPYRKEILFLLIFFLCGPIIFTNLYSVHTYYFYANNFFLSILLGFFILSLYKNDNFKIKYFGIFILFPFILLSLFSQYKEYYYSYQVNNIYSIIQATDTIKKITKPNDVILVYGQDWNPSFSYYAQRKAIMNRQKLPLNNKIMQESIQMVGKISALIVSNINDMKFINDQIQYLKFNETPIYSDAQTSIFLPK